MMFFEEIVVGEVADLGAHTFTAEEIKRFASAFDPQPFHLDEDGGRGEPFRQALRLRLAYAGGLDAP